MENKAKFLIIGLIGFLLLSIIVNLQTYNTKSILQREKDKLLADNQTLTQKADESQQKAKRLEDRVSVLTKDFESLNKEKEDFKRKLDLFSKEKQELIDRLKSLRQAGTVQEEPKQAAVQAAAPVMVEDAYWAGILKAKTDLELQLANLRNELKTAQINNEQLQREKSALQLDMNSMKRDKEDLQRQVEYNKKLLDSIAQELVREKNDKIQIQESIKTLKSENEVLTRQLKSLNNHKYALEKKVQELQEGKVAIERRFTEMETMLTEKVSMIDGLKVELEGIRIGVARREEAVTPVPKKESVELPPIVVRPQSQPEIRVQEGTTTLGGKILAINRDSNFVIIDLGEEAGVKIGDAFKVYREDKSIANIEVIQTRKNIAACDIKNEAAPIKIGDAVR